MPERASLAAPSAESDSEREHLDAQFVRKKRKRPKYGGRRKGSINKKTEEKLRKAELAVTEGTRGKKIAIDYMDDMIVWFRNLVGVLQPFDANGLPKPGYSPDIWFRAVSAFQGFLSMRAPYQSPRLSAVQIMPAQAQQRTTVNVTILNERGEKVFSDSDQQRGDDARLIEHAPMESEDGEATE